MKFAIDHFILGSGKKALLDAISHRADGKVKGNVMLNGTPLTKKLFQQKCGYVTNNDTFVHGLTIQQTLHYNAIKVWRATVLINN